MKRLLLPLWLLTLGLSGLLAVDVSESASQSARPAGGPDLAVLDALIVNSLEIADEVDPLLRAKGSTAVAQELADAVQRAAARGDTTQAATFNAWLTKVLDQGVRYNVDSLDPAELGGARSELWKDLNARPEAITKALETRLQALNPPLKQALAEADKKEKERNKFKDWGPKGKGKGKGKGKAGPGPWGDDFKGRWEKGDKKGKKEQAGLLPPLRTPRRLHFQAQDRAALATSTTAIVVYRKRVPSA